VGGLRDKFIISNLPFFFLPALPTPLHDDCTTIAHNMTLRLNPTTRVEVDHGYLHGECPER